MYKVILLRKGFPGKLSNSTLGWGSIILLQKQGCNILVDTGGIAMRAYLPGLLEQEGLKNTDIHYVLLTHLHFDHAGNVELFPQATFFVSQVEWDYANKPDNQDPYIQKDYLTFLQKMKKIGRLLCIQKDREILPSLDLQVMFSPGHTPGCVTYLLQQGGMLYGFAGDAIKNRGELTGTDVQISLDPEESKKSIQKIRSCCNYIYPGHDTLLTLKEGRLIEEQNNVVHILFGEGITVNGGKTEINICIDSTLKKEK